MLLYLKAFTKDILNFVEYSGNEHFSRLSTTCVLYVLGFPLVRHLFGTVICIDSDIDIFINWNWVDTR